MASVLIAEAFSSVPSPFHGISCLFSHTGAASSLVHCVSLCCRALYLSSVSFCLSPLCSFKCLLLSFIFKTAPSRSWYKLGPTHREWGCAQHFHGDCNHIGRWLPFLLFSYKSQFHFPEQKMPVLEPRSTASDKGSGLCVPVIRLMLWFWAWSAGTEDKVLEGLLPVSVYNAGSCPALGGAFVLIR